MSDDLDMRRRRAAWRASHRGTKEMDVLLGRFAETTLASMGDPELAQFEQFLALPDPDLQRWLLEGAPASGDFAPLVHDIRTFHGLAVEVEE